ncbi:hypothetical protein AXF42_Ash012959 [Apostasia shenzhenica]|uniref:Uncharacterized protein n=1 Tax=Apostasia shenzhenica TaxID=1088818 RepID=A0A2I0ARZ1_9ASPA|nr:hypothetical protein AXF42_Ash012959 [Apostasia shenzhenica]
MKESHAAGSKSGGSTTTDGGTSSVSSSPTSVCRPIDEVVAETQLKGSIIDRVRFLESRLVKLEDEIENEKLRAVEESKPRSEKKRHMGLKNMVKSYIKRSNSKINE